ncbi:hypothetical protein ALCH109712_15950 [Alkalicoccus chagannorensis]
MCPFVVKKRSNSQLFILLQPHLLERIKKDEWKSRHVGDVCRFSTRP